jgi:hypothetical protein
MVLGVDSKRSQGEMRHASLGIEEEDDMHFSPFMLANEDGVQQMKSYNSLRFAPLEEGMKAHLIEEEDSSVDGSESSSNEDDDY